MKLPRTYQRALLAINLAYQKAAKDALIHFANGERPDSEHFVEYRRRLTDLRFFLDHNGFKIARRAYKYKHYDLRTWKYIDDPYFKGTMLNPNFIY